MGPTWLGLEALDVGKGVVAGQPTSRVPAQHLVHRDQVHQAGASCQEERDQLSFALVILSEIPRPFLQPRAFQGGDFAGGLQALIRSMGPRFGMQIVLLL